jgi:excisionase family DNA binding protein
MSTAEPLPKSLTIEQVNRLPALVCLEDACRVLGISRSTGLRMIAKGTWPTPAPRVGRNFRISTLALLEYLEYPVSA